MDGFISVDFRTTLTCFFLHCPILVAYSRRFADGNHARDTVLNVRILPGDYQMNQQADVETAFLHAFFQNLRHVLLGQIQIAGRIDDGGLCYARNHLVVGSKFADGQRQTDFLHPGF